MKVGDTVFRVKYDKIEDGEIVRSYRGIYSSSGEWIPKTDGNRVCFVARFGTFDYLGQTYEWKFFVNVKNARTALARQARQYAEECRNKAVTWDKIVSDMEIANAGT